MKKRESVPFDTRYFSNGKNLPECNTAKEKFTFIHQTNFWSGSASVSGEGSDETQTAELQQLLPQVLKELDVKVLLDIPCGDFNWMKNVELPVEQYIGADIVSSIVDSNRAKYANKKRSFIELDIITSALPESDMVFCRDCLVHLSLNDIAHALRNIRNSGARYLATTTFTKCQKNEDIATGDWRILNLELAPFFFPPPLKLINERCTEGQGTYADKCIGIWDMQSIML